MPPKRNARSRQPSRSSTAVSVIASTITAQNNSETFKNFSITVLLPDIGVRTIVIDRISVDFTNATSTEPGGVVWLSWIGAPMAAYGSSEYSSGVPKTQSPTTTTTCMLRPRFAAQRLPIAVSSTPGELRVHLISSSIGTVATTSRIVIRTHYRLMPDYGVTVVP
jgi:hypothetical protein